VQHSQKGMKFILMYLLLLLFKLVQGGIVQKKISKLIPCMSLKVGVILIMIMIENYGPQKLFFFWWWPGFEPRTLHITMRCPYLLTYAHEYTQKYILEVNIFSK
jgi:hypothetical protein